MADANPTVQTILDAAKQMDRAAKELRCQAALMLKDNDLTRAAESVAIIQNLIPNLRLDLFVTRPLRAIERYRG